MEYKFKNNLINLTAPFRCLDIYEVETLKKPSFVLQNRFKTDENIEQQSLIFFKDFETNYINFFSDKFDSETSYIHRTEHIDDSIISRTLNRSTAGNKIIWSHQENPNSQYYWCKSVVCEDRIEVFSDFKPFAEYCINFDNHNDYVEITLSIDLSKSKLGRLDHIVFT